MKEKPGVFQQKPHKRLEYETEFHDEVTDYSGYSVDAFTLEEIGPGTWRVYRTPERGSSTHADDYVDIPAHLGKVLRNMIAAQNRAHAEIYAGHNRPDHQLETGRYDEGAPRHDNKDANDENLLPENPDAEDETPIERSLVSRAMRETNCHRFVLEALNALRPPHPLGRVEGEQHLEAESRYFATRFPSIFEHVATGNPLHDARVMYERLSQQLDPLLNRAPLVGRIRPPYEKDAPAGYPWHSFIVLGRTKGGEILCAEKMDYGSMPFRISSLETICGEYQEKKAEKILVWEFAPADILTA